MRALTVRQPWAWAIIHGGKDVENRTRNLAGSYRGPVAIHAGLTLDAAGSRDEQIDSAFRRRPRSVSLSDIRGCEARGAFVGVVDLVDVHTCGPGCCSSPWAQRDLVVETWRGPLGQTRSAFRVHLVLSNPRPLAVPIPARGRLGLWTPDAEHVEQLREVA